MQIAVSYDDSPGTALAEALRLYRVGKECATAVELGVTQRQLCVMTGLSIAALQECMKVASTYDSDDRFIKAFQDHDLPAGAPYRTWGSFLISIGVNTISQREANDVLAYVKAAVKRVAMIAQGSADPAIAHATLGHLRSWLMGRIPPTAWATIDRNFFVYQRCSYCSQDAEEPELVEHQGLLLTKCNQCKAEGVTPSSVDWRVVAESYAAYAHECNHAAEIYRSA
jgi:hypothetical protein